MLILLLACHTAAHQERCWPAPNVLGARVGSFHSATAVNTQDLIPSFRKHCAQDGNVIRGPTFARIWRREGESAPKSRRPASQVGNAGSIEERYLGIIQRLHSLRRRDEAICRRSADPGGFSLPRFSRMNVCLNRRSL